jgi:hypothetical protein
MPACAFVALLDRSRDADEYRMRPNKDQMARRIVPLIGAMVALLMVATYFTWCPRFGHGGATDEDQVAAAAIANGALSEPVHVWVVHNYALASWTPREDGRTEMLFVRKLCRWTLVTITGVGFDREMLRQRGVPSRDANALYALLLEGYADGP